MDMSMMKSTDQRLSKVLIGVNLSSTQSRSDSCSTIDEPRTLKDDVSSTSLSDDESDEQFLGPLGIDEDNSADFSKPTTRRSSFIRKQAAALSTAPILLGISFIPGARSPTS